jgi:hypothetical protein
MTAALDHALEVTLVGAFVSRQVRIDIIGPAWLKFLHEVQACLIQN